METPEPRNVAMVQRIEASTFDYPFRFVFAGDSGAWPDPTADGIFVQLVSQIDELDPVPVFFANLGDFAGPGTIERHEHYLSLVEGMSIPNICAIGNHDLDDEQGPDSFAQVHGPAASVSEGVLVALETTGPGSVMGALRRVSANAWSMSTWLS